MMTLRLFDCQDYPTLDAMPNMYAENSEIENYDYLRECIGHLESKDPGVNFSVTSTSTSDIGLQGNSLDDVNLSNIDFNFIKIENLLLQNVEESEHGTKNKEVKQEKSMDINISDSIENFDTVSLGYNAFSNFSDNSIKQSDDLSTVINNNECYTFNKDLTAQCTDIKQTTEFYNCSIKPLTKDNNEQSDVDEQVQTCEQCLMTFRYKRHLDRHLEGHKKNNCPHCNDKFARRKHLEVHLFRAHGERIIKHPYLCDVCPKSFPKRALLNHHRAKHNYQSGRVCSECGDMIKSDTDKKEHEENHCKKKQFKCEQCSQTFSIEQTYLSHMQNHNNHKCPNCEVSFASKKKAHEHFKAVHTSKSSESETINNDPHYCASCRHKFVKKDDYFRHLESALHLNKVNRDAPIKAIFSCTICSKKLFTQRALDQHIRRIHKGEKRFACDIYGCTFQCARRTDLDRHKHLHVEERNVVCEHCGKTFTSVSILKDHVLYIHSKERQFICEECGKAFKRNSLLKRHKLSHAQHRPFVCMQCSTAFKRSHHLTRHMEACHRITLEKKKKVMKLMKTEDGNLVPVPEKPKRSKSSKLKTKKERKPAMKQKEKDQSIMNINEQIASVELQPQNQPSSTNSEENAECPNLSLELTSLPVIDSTPQVLSLVDINTGQMLTVQVTNPELLSNNELVDQFETNCNEMLNLPDYQDIEFQSSLLNADQACYDSTSYSEVSLENIEDSVPLMNNNCKIEEIERYLIREFSPFYNL
ncbi:zinc finger protein 93-like isoform X2 [Harpegnathos saltator]|uniref:zinc finger protein 93-like isoform X2 n=1 Tax=Harpegnathos saltator TaxID=610380 RepID=UPI00058F6ADA|nr:zinc finger protein 93-like isoform X2 [Harpegnathos saltator]